MKRNLTIFMSCTGIILLLVSLKSWAKSAERAA